MKYALAVDFGTQSVRSIVFDSNGKTICEYREIYETPYFSKKYGYAEQDVDYYFNKFLKTTKKLAENHPEILKDLLGCSISCFRDTAVFLDENYKPLRPCILWLDQRLASKPNFPLKQKILFFLSGMTEAASINFRRTASNWVKENEKDIWAKTKHYFSISTYFIYRLTNKAVDSPSSYTGHYPINCKKRKWQTKHSLTYPVFDIPLNLLPELKQVGEPLGEITLEASKLTGLPVGLKIYGGGGDKSLESIGVGMYDSSLASLSYGTACSIEILTKRYCEPETFLPAYVSPIPNHYNMEIQIYRGYWMLEWFAKNFAAEEISNANIQKSSVEEILNKKMLSINPGADGLILEPYWGPGLKRPLAKGAILGFSDFHTKYHIYRAIIEGIAFALKEGLINMQKRRKSKKIKEIRISGGGSKSEAICQITADIFNLPVSKIQTFESASLGAAIIVFTASKYYSSYKEAIQKMVHISKTYYPNKTNAKLYTKIFKEVYLHIYPRTKKINYSIRRILNKSQNILTKNNKENQ